jgi:hypothetical protein
MVSFLRKRLQVFVSSTYSDLIQERQAAVESILTAGHIPAGMELFTSGDESQMEVIKQWIDESDVYLLILAGRYGSVEPKTKKSYTQLEYEYALNTNKPLFACVINESALENRVKTFGTNAIEMANPQKLKEFRSNALTRMVRFWDDSKDIKIAIGETLAQFSRRDELIGWVRPNNEANMPALADEIARLSKENALLRAQVSQAGMNDGKNDNINGLSFDELLAILDDKNLLDVLAAIRLELVEPLPADTSIVNRNELNELSILGILSLTTIQTEYGEYEAFRLTDEGRKFINKLEYRFLSRK